MRPCIGKSLLFKTVDLHGILFKLLTHMRSWSGKSLLFKKVTRDLSVDKVCYLNYWHMRPCKWKKCVIWTADTHKTMQWIRSIIWTADKETLQWKVLSALLTLMRPCTGKNVIKLLIYMTPCRRKSVLSGPGCSKLTTLLVNVSLKFQTLISDICQYFLLKQDLSQRQDSSPDSILPIT